MIRALPWVPVVMMPACDPVSDRACRPWSWIAMASSAALIRSPAVSSMSSSRGGGSGETCRARSISSSVVSPIAEMTTTTSWPSCLVATIRLATRLMLSASATDEPPYFCTTRPTPPPLLLTDPSPSAELTLVGAVGWRPTFGRPRTSEILGVCRRAGSPCGSGTRSANKAVELLSDHLAEGPADPDRVRRPARAGPAAPRPTRTSSRSSPTCQVPTPADRPPGGLEEQDRREANALLAKDKAERRVAEADPRLIAGLTVAVGIAWTATVIIYFSLVSDWKIFIVPIALSIALAKLKGQAADRGLRYARRGGSSARDGSPPHWCLTSPMWMGRRWSRWPAGRRAGGEVRGHTRDRTGVRVVRGDHRRRRRRRPLHRDSAPAAPRIALAAIDAGKALLVEKTFTATVRARRRSIQAARNRGVFVMEAMWTRFQPAIVERPELSMRGRSARCARCKPTSGWTGPTTRRSAVRPGAGRWRDARSRGLRRVVRAVLPRRTRLGRGDRLPRPDRRRRRGRAAARLRRRPGRVATDVAAEPDPWRRAAPRHRWLDRGSAALPPSRANHPGPHR